MQNAIILSQTDIKKIIAQHFHVDESKVMASKYSFVVAVEPEKVEEKE